MNVSTGIEWTGATVNPIRRRLPNGRVGHYCEKISAGCKNCYASRLQPRFGLPQFQDQRTDRAKKPDGMFLDTEVLRSILRRKKATTIFWCDMTDMFGDWVPYEWIAACFGVMAATPWHTHQVLTKRVERAAAWFKWIIPPRGLGSCELDSCLFHAHGQLGEPLHLKVEGTNLWSRTISSADTPWPLRNVHIGVSAEDQATFDERIRFVHDVPAAIHYLSLEPLLGSIKLSSTARLHIDWAIVGGESGQSARVTRLEHIRGIVWQCHDAGIPVFLKQLGARVEYAHNENAPVVPLRTRHKKGGNPEEWPPFLFQDVHGKRQKHFNNLRMLPLDLWPGACGL